MHTFCSQTWSLTDLDWQSLLFHDEVAEQDNGELRVAPKAGNELLAVSSFLDVGILSA